LDGKAAGLVDAALYVFRSRPQVAVASVDIAPGVDDTDDRVAAPVGAVKTELLQPRTVAERAQIVLAEPAVAAEFFGRLFLGRRHAWTRFLSNALCDGFCVLDFIQ